MKYRQYNSLDTLYSARQWVMSSRGLSARCRSVTVSAPQTSSEWARTRTPRTKLELQICRCPWFFCLLLWANRRSSVQWKAPLGTPFPTSEMQSDGFLVNDTIGSTCGPKGPPRTIKGIILRLEVSFLCRCPQILLINIQTDSDGRRHQKKKETQRAYLDNECTETPN